MSFVKCASVVNVVLVLALLSAVFAVGVGSPSDLTVLLTFLLVSSAAYFDLTTHRIPNWLTYGAACAALVWQTVLWIMAWQQAVTLSWQDSLLGGMLCGGMMFGLWKMKAIGGGDVKLSIALGLLMGLVPAVTGILMAHLVAAGFVVTWLIVRRLVVNGSLALPTMWTSKMQMDEPLSGKTRLPMAGFYAAGVFMAMWAM